MIVRSKVLPDVDGTLFVASANTRSFYKMDTMGNVISTKKITDKLNNPESFLIDSAFCQMEIKLFY